MALVNNRTVTLLDKVTDENTYKWLCYEYVAINDYVPYRVVCDKDNPIIQQPGFLRERDEWVFVSPLLPCTFKLDKYLYLINRDLYKSNSMPLSEVKLGTLNDSDKYQIEEVDQRVQPHYLHQLSVSYVPVTYLIGNVYGIDDIDHVTCTFNTVTLHSNMYVDNESTFTITYICCLTCDEASNIPDTLISSMFYDKNKVYNDYLIYKEHAFMISKESIEEEAYDKVTLRIFDLLYLHNKITSIGGDYEEHISSNYKVLVASILPYKTVLLYRSIYYNTQGVLLSSNNARNKYMV